MMDEFRTSFIHSSWRLNPKPDALEVRKPPSVCSLCVCKGGCCGECVSTGGVSLGGGGFSCGSDKMVKKRKQKEKNSRGVAAMEDDTPAVPEREALPESKAGGEAMDTAEVDLPESTGVELDFLQPKKKRKKKGSKSNGLQIQGLIGKKEPPKRKAVKQRKEKSIERALVNMDKQQEKQQKDGVKAERVSSLKNLY